MEPVDLSVSGRGRTAGLFLTESLNNSLSPSRSPEHGYTSSVNGIDLRINKTSKFW